MKSLQEKGFNEKSENDSRALAAFLLSQEQGMVLCDFRVKLFIFNILN